MRSRWVLCVAIASGIWSVGCSSETEEGPGRTLTFLISDLNVGAASATDQNIVPGINLDDKVSDAADVRTCGRPDFTSPPPDSEPGIDNQLGPLLASFASLLDISEILKRTISNGNLLVLVRVSDVNDFVNDDLVEISLLRGKLPMGTTPAVDGEGNPLAGQTFPIDEATLDGDGEPMATVRGRIRSGRLYSDTFNDFTIPVRSERLALHFDIVIRDVKMRLNMTENSIVDGVLGGSVGVEETAENIRMYSEDLSNIIRPVFSQRADLDFDGTDDECASISAGMVFGGVPATEGERVSSSQ